METALSVHPQRVDTEFAEIVAELRKVRHDATEVPAAKLQPYEDPTAPATPVRESEGDVPTEAPDDTQEPEPEQTPEPEEEPERVNR